MTNKELRLTRRIAELNERLEELSLPNDPMRGDYDRRFYAALSAAETDHVLPEHLFTVQDVLAALSRAADALRELRCERTVEADGSIPGQLALAPFGRETLPLAS